MLGKDHINISIAFFLPFLIPFFFLNVGNFNFLIALMVSIFIGSILPDADCGGKATIYYRFPVIDGFMKKVVGKLIIKIFEILVTKEKIKTEFDVKDEHRGIMHSPIGVLFSSLLLTLPILIFVLLLNLFNFIVILGIFLGLLIGQFLHLFQDSCTVSGINWGFPFKPKELKGTIYTFSKDSEKADVRPLFYSGIFYFLTILLVIGYAFEFLNNFNLIFVFSLIMIYDIFAFFTIIKISNSTSSFWMFPKKTINKIRRSFRRNNLMVK